jgi:putative FmdB family regulatory protein
MIYRYLCDNCQCEFEEYQSIKDASLTKCPNCEQETLHRVITGGAGIIDKTPRTLGTLAEQNRKKFGRDYCEAKEREIKERTRKAKKHLMKLPEGAERLNPEPYQPFWRKGKLDTSLGHMTKEQTRRYIHHGKKP